MAMQNLMMRQTQLQKLRADVLAALKKALKNLRADVLTTLKAHIGFNQGIKSSQSIRDSIHFPKYQ